MDINPHTTTFDPDDQSHNPLPVSLTSPIVRLPTELLSDIFQVLMDSYNLSRDMEMVDTARAAILAVCVRWRTIAFNLGALWTCFAFVITTKKLERWDEYMAWVTTWVGCRSPNADLPILVRPNTRSEAVNEMRTLSAFLKDEMYSQTCSLEIDDDGPDWLVRPPFPLRGGLMPRLASVNIYYRYPSTLLTFSGDAPTPGTIYAPLLSEITLDKGSASQESMISSFPALEKLQLTRCSHELGPDRTLIVLPHLKSLSVDHPEVVPLYALHAPQLVELSLTYGRFIMSGHVMMTEHEWRYVNGCLRKSNSPDPFPRLRTVRMEAPLTFGPYKLAFYIFVLRLINDRPHIRTLWYTPVVLYSSCKPVIFLLDRILHLEELHLTFSLPRNFPSRPWNELDGFLDLWPAMRGLLVRSQNLKLWWSLEVTEPLADVERMCAELSSEFPGRFIARFDEYPTSSEC